MTKKSSNCKKFFVSKILYVDTINCQFSKLSLVYKSLYVF